MSAETAPEQADWGRTVETAACERWGLEAIAGDPDEPWWFDARATRPVDASPFGTVIPGTPVESKAARYRIADGGTTRRGQWWLRQPSHERLVEADGEYVLAVYTPENGVLSMRLVPAWWVDDLSLTWSACGDRHHADRAARVPWSRVFDTGEVIVGSSLSGGASA
jgi:hypothetical protein